MHAYGTFKVNGCEGNVRLPNFTSCGTAHKKYAHAHRSAIVVRLNLIALCAVSVHRVSFRANDRSASASAAAYATASASAAASVYPFLLKQQYCLCAWVWLVIFQARREHAGGRRCRVADSRSWAHEFETQSSQKIKHFFYTFIYFIYFNIFLNTFFIFLIHLKETWKHFYLANLEILISLQQARW